MEAVTIFQYKIYKRIAELLLITLLFSLFIFLFSDAENNNLSRYFVSALTMLALMFTIYYANIVNESIEMGMDEVRLRKKIGKNRAIPFNEIRRVTIREQENTAGQNYQIMTIFGRQENIKIDLSSLGNAALLKDQILSRSQVNGFPLIQQDINGKILT